MVRACLCKTHCQIKIIWSKNKAAVRRPQLFIGFLAPRMAFSKFITDVFFKVSIYVIPPVCFSHLTYLNIFNQYLQYHIQFAGYPFTKQVTVHGAMLRKPFDAMVSSTNPILRAPVMFLSSTAYNDMNYIKWVGIR